MAGQSYSECCSGINPSSLLLVWPMVPAVASCTIETLFSVYLSLSFLRFVNSPKSKLHPCKNVTLSSLKITVSPHSRPRSRQRSFPKQCLCRTTSLTTDSMVRSSHQPTLLRTSRCPSADRAARSLTVKLTRLSEPTGFLGIAKKKQAGKHISACMM